MSKNSNDLNTPELKDVVSPDITPTLSTDGEIESELLQDDVQRPKAETLKNDDSTEETKANIELKNDHEVDLHSTSHDKVKKIMKAGNTAKNDFDDFDDSNLSEEQEEAVYEFFDVYPNEKEVYMTSDCNCFFVKDRNAAIDHKIKNNLKLHLCKRDVY